MIRGERIVLRDIYDSDLEKMVVWRNDPEVSKYFFDCQPTNIERQRVWVEAYRKRDDEKLFIISSVEEPNRPLGTVGLIHIDNRHGRAEWGRFCIGELSARGRGLAEEAIQLSLKYAFETLNLQRVYLEVFSWNEKARLLYEKFGFKVEGTYRSHVFRQGHYNDVTIYGLLRSEFLQNKQMFSKIM